MSISRVTALAASAVLDRWPLRRVLVAATVALGAVLGERGDEGGQAGHVGENDIRPGCGGAARRSQEAGRGVELLLYQTLAQDVVSHQVRRALEFRGDGEVR